MKDIKTALAKKNGLNRERYTEIVIEEVKKEFPSKNEEIAILRKEVAYLRGVIESITGKKLPASEFSLYNEKVENIKLEARIKTGVY